MKFRHKFISPTYVNKILWKNMIPIYKKIFFVKIHPFLASRRPAACFPKLFILVWEAGMQFFTQVLLLYGREMYLGQNGLTGFLKSIFNFSKNGSFEIFKKQKTGRRPAGEREKNHNFFQSFKNIFL